MIYRFVGARALNTFGRAVISATVLWELYERTRDPLVLAAVGLVQVIPVVLLFVPSGALVDRMDRRRLATAAATLTGVVGIGLAIASAMHAPVWVYLALLLVLGGCTSIHAPAASSLLPMIIDRSELVRANRILASFSEISQISGPALAGLSLAIVDAHWIYAFVAVSGLASGILYRSLPAPRASEAAPESARKDWRAGLRFIWKSPLLLPALTLDMFAVLFAGVTALLPAIATDILHVGPVGYGILRAAQSVGAVSMAIIGGRLAAWQRPGRVLLIVVALFGLVTIGVGLSRSLPVTVVLLVICGALDNISVVIRLSLEQLVVPDYIRGRVGAVHFVFIGMSNELGAAESGIAAELLGVVPAIVVGGALATIIVGIVALKWPALANMPPLAQLTPET
ncbi:MAG: MFS transporter [Myxococcota bacterium]|nr:MFS transporter [Deltaproteobacteria bacterium]MDQ3338457.1 MFS transporter [Myxococcota bacterium]